jgi:hypothetical protein
MNLRRTLLIAAALLVIVLGALTFGLPGNKGAGAPTAAACARCGDGVCAKSCENKYSCPQDCGGTVSTGSTTAPARRAR